MLYTHVHVCLTNKKMLPHHDVFRGCLCPCSMAPDGLFFLNANSLFSMFWFLPSSDCHLSPLLCAVSECSVICSLVLLVAWNVSWAEKLGNLSSWEERCPEQSSHVDSLTGDTAQADAITSLGPDHSGDTLWAPCWRVKKETLMDADRWDLIL